MNRLATTFEEGLLPMLKEAADQRGARTYRPPRRVASRRITSTVMVVAATAVALVIVGSASGRGGTVTVDARSALLDPQGVVAELAEDGIEAQIVGVPVRSEAAIGTWNAITFDHAGAISTDAFESLRDGEEGYGSTEIDLPKEISGTVTLFVNRAAGPGERGWFFEVSGLQAYALSPVGAFWCLRLEEADPVTAVERLEGLGYSVRLMWVERNLSVSSIEDIPERSEVAWIVIRSPDLVDLRLTDPELVDWVRESIGAPSTAFPRSTWSSWAPDC